jgi:hypothetical protein
MVLFLGGGVFWQGESVRTLSKHNAMLAADYQDVLVADNRMTRSRTNFEYPRMGGVELKAISEVAQALSWPWELHAAIEKTENGGMHLELGAKKIPEDIRQNFPPNLWQRATAVRIMQEEAGKMILLDPEVTYVFAARLARRWGALDQAAWQENFITELNKWRGEGVVVRPDKHAKQKAARRKRR